MYGDGVVKSTRSMPSRPSRGSHSGLPREGRSNAPRQDASSRARLGGRFRRRRAGRGTMGAASDGSVGATRDALTGGHKEQRRTRLALGLAQTPMALRAALYVSASCTTSSTTRKKSSPAQRLEMKSGEMREPSSSAVTLRRSAASMSRVAPGGIWADGQPPHQRDDDAGLHGDGGSRLDCNAEARREQGWRLRDELRRRRLGRGRSGRTRGSIGGRVGGETRGSVGGSVGGDIQRLLRAKICTSCSR